MTMETIHYPTKTAIVAGIAGGIVGGVAMYGIMAILMTQIGMGANCFAIIMGMITGQPYDKAVAPGIVVHFLTSIAIGTIFGAVISTKKLQIRGFGKGIGLGIATGIIAFVIIFLPIAMTVLPGHMMDIMKMMPMSGNMGTSDNNMNGGSMNEKSSMQSNSMNQQSSMSGGSEMQGKSAMDEKMKMEEMNKMMMEDTQKMLPMILGGAFISHIAFGAALGVVVTSIVRRKEKSLPEKNLQ